MKKQLPTNTIANELSGASVFFQKSASPPEPETPLPHSDADVPQLVDQHPRNKMAMTTNAAPQQQQGTDTKPPVKQPDSMVTSNHATMPPHNHEIPVDSHQDSMPTSSRATTLPTPLETIRKTVKQVGKEAATYRLTEEEKQHLADIVYTYKRRGYRTSDNELARIAINWLILDYQEEGEQSVLARVLEALHR
jgi:hypothetical protein